MTGNEINTAEDYRSYILNSIFEDIGLITSPTDGSGIHIGIVDSVHQPPEWIRHKFDIYSTRQFVDSDSELCDIGHGIEIFDIICRIVPKATFSFYQAFGSERHTGVTPYTNAIDRAIEDNVDILNLSLGAPNQIPARASPYYPPIERAIENDIIPVAAAGNLEYDDGPKQYIYSPANIPEVVAVSGSETICPATPVDENRAQKDGPYHFSSDDQEYAFCSYQGCVDGTPCVRKKSTRPWSRNTKPLNEKPDVLAPAHFPTIVESQSIEDVKLKRGTSYSAPLVTGAIAKCLYESDLLPENIIDKLPGLLTESGDSVDNYPAPKFNAFNFESRIKKEVYR